MHGTTKRNTLRVSDVLSVHHQESKTVHTASGICHTDDGRRDRLKHVECYSFIDTNLIHNFFI